MFKSLMFLTIAAIVNTASAKVNNFFVHITDAHVDMQYKPGSAANCLVGDKLGTHCCREYSIPIKPYRKANQWGDYNCDSPPLLVNKTIEWISKMDPPPDFIIYTGDSPGHHDITQTVKKNWNAINFVTEQLYRFKRVYPNIGNHDTWPVDQLLPPPNNHYLTSFLAKIWSPWVNDTNLANYGYYSIMISQDPPVKLISLNTLYFDKHNLLIKHSSDNIGNQWSWFEKELQLSDQANQTIWLIGHVYPGNGEAMTVYTEAMISLMQKYSDLIRYQFWGHSHDDFHFVYPNKTGSGWVTPSIMPDDHFPAFRVYEYDPTTMTILNYIQYTANLTTTFATNLLHFTPEYDALSSYNLPDMESKSWVDLYYKLYKNATLFQNYYSHYKTEHQTTACNSTCQTSFLDGLMV